MARLAGKIAFITGASGGIGAEAARLFAAEGATVVVSARREAEGEAVAAAIRDAGGRAHFIATDVTDEASVAAAMAGTFNRFGRLDVLYNNAGGSRASDGPVTQGSVEAFWETIRLDLFGTWLCCRKGIPLMQQGGGGAIIHTASIMGAMGLPNRDAYTAAKGGIIALTRSMAVEYAKDNIRVNCLVPGAVATERVLGFYEKEPQLKTQWEAYLLGLATPRDVAEAALFLASDAAGKITGHALPVDSGILIS